MVKIILKPLTKSFFDNGEINDTPYFIKTIALNDKMETIIMAMKSVAFALMSNYTVATTNIVITFYPYPCHIFIFYNFILQLLAKITFLNNTTNQLNDYLNLMGFAL
jgi:hypothetical protein